jgi:competence protein ComEA
MSREWWVAGHAITARGPPRDAGTRPDRSEKPRPTARLININTATVADLEAFPGIGPIIARRIVEGRPYHSVDDLDRVKGIGKERLEETQPFVRAE